MNNIDADLKDRSFGDVALDPLDHAAPFLITDDLDRFLLDRLQVALDILLGDCALLRLSLVRQHQH